MAEALADAERQVAETEQSLREAQRVAAEERERREALQKELAAANTPKPKAELEAELEHLDDPFVGRWIESWSDGATIHLTIRRAGTVYTIEHEEKEKPLKRVYSNVGRVGEALEFECESNAGVLMDYRLEVVDAHTLRARLRRRASGYRYTSVWRRH